MTHEEFISKVRALAVAGLDAAERDRLMAAKLVYGGGMHGAGVRGVTCFGAWKHGSEGRDFIEVSAAAEESTVQLAGTTVHELAHCLAGYGAGHGPAWKGACERLGMRCARAAGMVYQRSAFTPRLRLALALLAPLDGQPTFTNRAPAVGGAPAPLVRLVKPRPCSMGIGTRGGRSRGVGSGSRLRLWECACTPVVKVRVASDDFRATCNRCDRAFTRKGA